MRVKTVQVMWHDEKPVYSVDFHPSGIFATGGGDKDVKVVLDKDQNTSVKHLGNLVGHTRDVNTVRFSPSGQLLASGGVAGEMFLWKPSTETQKTFGSEESDAGWRSSAVLRGHAGDVQDIAWAPDSSALMSGSVENICIMWDVEGASRKCRLEDHRNYVQGVAWDPASEFVVSQSADRTCRVYGSKGPVVGKKKVKRAAPSSSINSVLDLQCLHLLSKRAMPASAVPSEEEQDGVKPQPHRCNLFHDEQLNSFFRRLAWSPDGSFLVVPCGQYKQTIDSPTLSTAYVYARGHWNQPFLRLPATNKPVVAVRFCPQLFRLQSPAQASEVADTKQQTAEQGGGSGHSCHGTAEKQEGSAPQQPFQLPYRMLFAIATLDSIIIYDTQKATPLAVLGALHFEAITDLAWSYDGAYLAISSYDGFCSIASFEKGELGEAMPGTELPQHIRERVVCAYTPASSAAATPQMQVPLSASARMPPPPPPPSTQQEGQRLPEEDDLTCLLPIRQLNSSNMGQAAKSGTKRIVPPTLGTGVDPVSVHGVKKPRRIAPQAI